MNMARSKFSFWEVISGKVGPVVAFSRYGKQYVRVHTIPRDPKTPAQLAQRAKLKLANKGLSPLNKVIRQGYKEDSTAYRTLVGKIIRELIVGEYPDFSIDYSKIQIAKGRMLLPEHVTATFNPDTRRVSFNWDTQLPAASKWNKADDIVHIAFLHQPTLEVIKLPGIVNRSHGLASFELPAEWQPAGIHCWFYLSSRYPEENSKSLYVKI